MSEESFHRVTATDRFGLEEGGGEMGYSFSCRDYPGMGICPGLFVAETEEELWKHIELHGKLAHQEDPAAWSREEREQVKRLIRPV